MKRTPLKRKTRLLSRREKPRKKAGKLPERPARARRLKEPAYLDHVRRQPCALPGCRFPSQCHHYGKRGKSMKCDDSEVVPLCFHHHIEWFHTKGHLPGMTAEETRALFRATGSELRRNWEDARK